eukprot:TRINITY_DN24009_c0_g1_i1.p1 TRINITY_DN24009_c0_g1~~TRINITY_DN24009_c0_g1_i1.p1  ORF type:complete len:372 (+),score=59.19 TRINITY_DN24009_c0_g1_i1:536-1651(+)
MATGMGGKGDPPLPSSGTAQQQRHIVAEEQRAAQVAPALPCLLCLEQGASVECADCTFLGLACRRVMLCEDCSEFLHSRASCRDHDYHPTNIRLATPTTFADLVAYIRTQKWRDLLLSIAYFFLAVFVMTFSLNYVHQRMPDPTHNEALPDLLQQWTSPIGSDLPAGFGFYALILTCAVSAFAHFKHNIIPPMMRFMQAWGTGWYIRVLFLVATALPPTTNYYCRYDYPNYPKDFPHPIPNIWWNTFIGVITFGNGNIHCGDLMYSGHSVLLTVSWVFVVTYMRHLPLLCLFQTVLFLATILFIIVERHHYTVDIMVGVFVTCTFWAFTPERLYCFLQRSWWRSTFRTAKDVALLRWSLSPRRGRYDYVPV